MPVFDLFSHRKPVAEGETRDVFVYDELPDALRVQLIYIWRDSIGQFHVNLGSDFEEEAGQVREVLDILTWGVGAEVFASRPLAASYSRSSSSLAARI